MSDPFPFGPHPSNSFVEQFRDTPPEQRRLFLAEMAINNPEHRDLHRVLSELHQTLLQIE
jgi:hypothetical protein